MTHSAKETENLSSTLKPLTPGKRLKYIRQNLIKKNQIKFCEDGIVRNGTLKSIESERIKIGHKIAEKICHKLRLEGIECAPDIFTKEEDPCIIEINRVNIEIVGSALSTLQEINQKTLSLTPVEIQDENFSPIIPKGSTVMVKDLDLSLLSSLSKTLCFIKGNSAGLYLLTYESEDRIIAETYSGKQLAFAKSILELCAIYMVEVIYIKPQ